ncbi:MAG: ABC-F family ATP-binding cassette domain-containing protein [Bacteroidales bacterium]|nr:ABC-F family ATP-binding cassette domain-containing protein [Bacteroidales bacterium]
MASYLQIENISKSYGPKVLFDRIGFNINEGDKIALVAPNGAGKTSLMRILAGKDKSDSGGRILFLKDIAIAFLEQDYDADPTISVQEQIERHSAPMTASFGQERLSEYRQKVREMLSNFGLDNPSALMGSLSGGEVKRVALAETLALGADFLIMDEPTNHLDIDAIEFLESYLSRSRCTLLMVTHDRYFLDRVCNTVMELDHGQLFVYKGNYQNFLEKREQRIANYNAQTDKVRNLLRRELEWIRATPCARTGKAQYRINAFRDLKERAEQVYRTSQMDISSLGGSVRLGTKTIDCKQLSCYYGDECYLKDFSYKFQRRDKIGIVGRNGVGKSTFVDLLTGSAGPEARITGEIERGASLNIGYYRQSGIEFAPGETVLDIVGETRLLEQFLFPRDMWSTRVEKLSGGEKRRLYLLTVLRERPNFLILDEPTNDLDIVTLNVLEEYLREYDGSLMIVSHDRHFLDRTVDHLLVFCGEGVVKDFVGNFSEYRAYVRDYEKKKAASEREAIQAARPAKPASAPQDNVRRLTYKEKMEMQQLEADLASLAAEKSDLETRLNSGSLGYEELQKASARIGEIIAVTDEKEMRWLELSELSVKK